MEGELDAVLHVRLPTSFRFSGQNLRVAGLKSLGSETGLRFAFSAVTPKYDANFALCWAVDVVCSLVVSKYSPPLATDEIPMPDSSSTFLKTSGGRFR